MPGIAQYHFPLCVWKNGKRMLWNPIQKKLLKNRPEERVRLRIIEALTEMGWSKNRISTEEPINPKNEPGGRTDIICYDKDFSPRLLVECKAENVPISASVAEQTARYNRSVEAPYLMMSNGISDYWYGISEDRDITRLKKAPDFLNPPEKPDKRPFSYWTERGFAGEKVQKEARSLLNQVLNVFWFDMEGDIDFLSFDSSPTGMELAHYFKIFGGGDERIAVGFFNTPGGDTRLIAVFNREGKNAGLLDADFDSLVSGETPDSTLHMTTGSEKIDLREHGIAASELSDGQSLAELPLMLNTLFSNFA